MQTGFCRTGDWFASEHEDVVPDLVTTAKGIAGGLPLGAVTGRAELMDAVHPGGLGGTYGGNPLACVAALATIELFERGDLLARAARNGLLTLKAGIHDNVVRILAPLVMEDHLLDEGLDILDQALATVPA